MISPIPARQRPRGDRPVVVVETHVERLDLLRVVHQDHRLADVLLGDVALVLGLQVDAPLGPELELLLAPSRIEIASA